MVFIFQLSTFLDFYVKIHTIYFHFSLKEKNREFILPYFCMHSSSHKNDISKNQDHFSQYREITEPYTNSYLSTLFRIGIEHQLDTESLYTFLQDNF